MKARLETLFRLGNFTSKRCASGTRAALAVGALPVAALASGNNTHIEWIDRLTLDDKDKHTPRKQNVLLKSW